MMILRVALDVPLDTLFDYSATAQGEVAIGDRVLVSFGRRQMVGVVAEITDHSELAPGRIKPVLQVFHDVPPLSEEILRLLRFCADYYHHPLGEVILNALPVPLRQTKPVARAKPIGYRLTKSGLALAIEALPARAIVKRKLLQSLKETGTVLRSDISTLSISAPQALREFIELGWVEESDEIAESAPASTCRVGTPLCPRGNNLQTPRGHKDRTHPTKLTAAQEQAVAAILAEMAPSHMLIDPLHAEHALAKALDYAEARRASLTAASGTKSRT